MVLCVGIENYYSSKYDIRKICNSRKSGVRRHNRARRLTQEKNAARTEPRAVRKEGKEEDAIKEVVGRFHQLIRVHNNGSS